MAKLNKGLYITHCTFYSPAIKCWLSNGSFVKVCWGLQYISGQLSGLQLARAYILKQQKGAQNG